MTTTGASPELISLAAPAGRWTPTRAGLIALWRYWDETFTFHQGRLLLRGPNGSGKSMALELLLPFLLDGDASPSRLTSSAKSRGGLYERVMAGSDDPGRTGFAWVEFRRGDDEVFTVGARLRASASARKVETTLFTTTQAVGTELHLLDESREPLSGKALKAGLGERGQVNSTAADHRNAIREVLFPGFSEDRYASVITALLALRKEKLSQNLDLVKLSEVLTDALPPIDEHELAAVAEGFERLDRRKEELRKLEAEVAAVSALARRQRAYARAVVAGVAHEVREAESRRDAVTRAEREAGSALDEATGRDHTAEQQLAVLIDRLEDIEVEVEARHASKAYRKGVELAQLRTEERQRREQAERDFHAVAERTEAQAARAGELGEAQDQRRAAAGNLTVASDDVHQVASSLGADHLWQEMSDAADAEAGLAFGLAWAGARRQHIGEVREAVRRHGEAVMHRRFEEQRLEEDREVYDDAVTGLSDTRSAERAASEAYDADLAAWARASHSVDTRQVVDALGLPPFEPDRIETAVNGLRTDVQTGYAVAVRDLEGVRQEIVDRQSSLLDEQSSLEAGHKPDPEAPLWRDKRDGRPGAPLWHLVELAPGVEAVAIDGVEAALAASGLLDAWVSPDGVVDVSAHDLELVPGGHGKAGQLTLADLLVPLTGAAVAPGRVAVVLASIPVVPHVSSAATGGGTEVLMGTDGSFRLGSAVGRAPVGPAILLGAEARERRRLQRLSEVAAALDHVDTELDRVQRTRDRLDREQQAAAAHLDAVPPSVPLRQAIRAAEVAAQRVVDAEARAEASAGRLRTAEGSVREALRSLTSVAAGHGLPTDPDDLDQVEEELLHLERTVHTWAKRGHELAGAELRLSDRVAAHVEATELLAAAEETYARSRRQAQDAKVRLATLEATAGVEHKAVLAELEQLQDEARTKKRERQDLEELRRSLVRQIGVLTTTVEQAEQDRIEAGERRDTAHLRFVALAGDGVLEEAEVGRDGPLDGVTAVLAAARAVAVELEDGGDNTATQRASSHVDDALHAARSAVSGQADLSRDLGEHDWWVLRASVNGFRQSVLVLHRKLQADLTEGQADLAAEEERLFEQTLAGSIRRSLANRIRQANRLVAGINEQLSVVRTAAAGVAVRLNWEVDPDQPTAVRTARSLLLKDRVTDSERRDLQEFVRARVDQARAELEHHAPWEVRLRESLDYRAWHRFTLQLSHRDWEGWKPATAKRMQRLSTGERSIALHLPMLASIAAHYTDEEGQPSGCPRLILLDELFAGVDAANRAMLFGTFTAWDLDAVFTSDHEWCQYATLSGIAIHHLHPPDGDGPLVSTRFTWDGRRRVIDPTGGVTGLDPATRRLEVAGLAPLVAELARRFADGAAMSAVTVRDLDEEQQGAIADLLGQDRLPGRRAMVRVATLVAVLGLSDGDELRNIVEEIVGPLGNRRADREERRRQRAQLWSWCTEQIEGVPLLIPGQGARVWVDQLRRAGIRGGETGERAFRQRLEQAVTVLRALPVSGTVSLASFADDQLSDPHALDRGGTLEGLVLDGLALGVGVERPRDAEAVRQLWEQVGVVPDPCSSTVTVLGLRPSGAGELARWLRHCADASEPAVVTLAQLRRWPMDALDRSVPLYVVENPSVISDAASGGWTGPPIICSSGRPSVAVVTLIRRLGAKGAACRQHADFDGAGLAITAWLADRAGTTPWLMTAEAYGAAVAMRRGRVHLQGDLPDTPWDPLLAPAMREGGVAVYEEELRFSLLSAMES